MKKTGILILVVVLILTGCSKEKVANYNNSRNKDSEENTKIENLESEDSTTEVPTYTEIQEEFTVLNDAVTIELEDLTIHIPKKSYMDETHFTIHSVDFSEHEFNNVKPLTPLYEIDNGEVFSENNLFIEVHIELEVGQFAMPFFYDEKTEEIESIPILYQDENKIVLITRHFSNIFIGLMDEEQLMTYKDGGSVSTNFQVGVDDFSFTNRGSFIAPNGHCSGQCLSALWYFYNIRRFDLTSGKNHLFGLLDNNGNKPTPDFWQDDSLLYRFASSVHMDSNKANNNMAFAEQYINELHEEYRDIFSTDYEYDHKLQWQGIVAALIATERPQLIFIESETSAHAIIAYKVDGNKIYVADPNYPGQLRYIEFDREKFKPYYSGDDFRSIEEEGEVAYTKAYFVGEFAVVDEWKIEKRWNEVINQVSENEYFPYPMIIKDQLESFGNTYAFNVEVLDKNIQPKLGFYLYDENLKLIQPVMKLSQIIPPKPYPLIPVNDSTESYTIKLPKEGDNKVGFYFVGKTIDEKTGNIYWEWESFEWVNVFVDTNLQLRASRKIINPGDTVQIEAYFESGLENIPQLKWYEDGNMKEFSAKAITYSSDKIGTHIIEANDDLHSLYANIEIEVTDEEIEEPLEKGPISEEETDKVEGTYNCKFWISSYEAIVFGEFKDTLWGTAEYHESEAIKSAESWNEAYQEKIGAETEDRSNFNLTINDDETCSVKFSDFLGVELATGGISNVPFNGGNISFTKSEDGIDYKGTISFSLKDDIAIMEGSVEMENVIRNNVKAVKVVSFEGEIN